MGQASDQDMEGPGSARLVEQDGGLAARGRGRVSFLLVLHHRGSASLSEP